MDSRLQWDIFCKVIDNYGDIGVCWRLSADLAGRGHRVRLWVDDASALGWMAPGGAKDVQVLPWPEIASRAGPCLAVQPTDVIVESFGCEIPVEFISACAAQDRSGGARPVWINLEYLSAEPYVERCHAMPSPVLHGPAAGWTKWFFYPGFSAATGGLPRELQLEARRQAFDAAAWLKGHGIAAESGTVVSLFCYEPYALPQLLQRWAQDGLDGKPVHLLVAAGRAQEAARNALRTKAKANPAPGQEVPSQLRVHYLPWLTQTDFDHLLWAADLNFVRGEDSLVRALWAEKPFVWHIYPQDDSAHVRKLEAFLETVDAPASLRDMHRAWNGAAARVELPGTDGADLEKWSSFARSLGSRLRQQPDLTSQLIGFVTKNR